VTTRETEKGRDEGKREEDGNRPEMARVGPADKASKEKHEARVSCSIGDRKHTRELLRRKKAASRGKVKKRGEEARASSRIEGNQGLREMKGERDKKKTSFFGESG